MNIFDDTRFTKKLNSIFNLLRKGVVEIPHVNFKDDDGFTHKFEFLWFKIQNNYWLGHTATRKNSVYAVENWTFDGRTMEITYHGPAYLAIKTPDKSIENTSFNVDDLLNKMDLLMVEMV